MPAEHYILVLTFCFTLLTPFWSSDFVIYWPRNKLFVSLREQSAVLHAGKNGDKVLWSLITDWKGSSSEWVLLLIDWQGSAAHLYSYFLRQSLISWEAQRCAWRQNSQNLLPWISKSLWHPFQPPKPLSSVWIIQVWSTNRYLALWKRGKN